jgi:hypothetical protein
MPINSSAVAEQQMFAYFLANLPTGYTAAKVQLPNAPFTRPQNSAWLRVTVIPFSTINTVATGCRQRTTGQMVVDIFWPRNTGSTAAMALAEEIKQTLTNQSTTDVSLYESEIVPLVNEAEWYHIQINTNYAHEGTTTA